MSKKFEFKGKWDRTDDGLWEIFRINLFGVDAGGYVDDPKRIKEILEMSGYELILRKKHKRGYKSVSAGIELAEYADQYIMDSSVSDFDVDI